MRRFEYYIYIYRTASIVMASKGSSEKRATRIEKDIKKVSQYNKALSFCYDVLHSYRYFKYIVAVLLVGEAILGYLIIQKIPCNVTR
jgi:hypothetical protein